MLFYSILLFLKSIMFKRVKVSKELFYFILFYQLQDELSRPPLRPLTSITDKVEEEEEEGEEEERVKERPAKKEFKRGITIEEQPTVIAEIEDYGVTEEELEEVGGPPN